MNKLLLEAIPEVVRDSMDCNWRYLAAPYAASYALRNGLALEAMGVSMDQTGRMVLVDSKTPDVSDRICGRCCRLECVCDPDDLAREAIERIDRDAELCLYDNCITYLDKLSITQAVKDMQYALEADVPNMNQIFDIFWAFYSQAEERVIGNMRPDWLIKFNAIGEEAFKQAMKSNPHHCAWTHVPEWYAEHEQYNGMRNGRRLGFCFLETKDPCALCHGSPEACDGCVNEHEQLTERLEYELISDIGLEL